MNVSRIAGFVFVRFYWLPLLFLNSIQTALHTRHPTKCAIGDGMPTYDPGWKCELQRMITTRHARRPTEGIDATMREEKAMNCRWACRKKCVRKESKNGQSPERHVLGNIHLWHSGDSPTRDVGASVCGKLLIIHPLPMSGLFPPTSTQGSNGL